MTKSKTTGDDGVVTIKKYANRRLYDTERSCYITLDDLGAMVRDGRDFRVVDAKSGEDITHNVLTQIIMDTETKGETLLPVNFLRHLIGLYGGMPQGAVGFSFGVERLISLLQDRASAMPELSPRSVLVAPIGKELGAAAENLAMALRKKGISARLGLSATAPGKHLQYAEATRLDWVVFVGEDEVKQGRYALRHLPTRSEQKLSTDEIISHLTAAKLAR